MASEKKVESSDPVMTSTRDYESGYSGEVEGPVDAYERSKAQAGDD